MDTFKDSCYRSWFSLTKFFIFRLPNTVLKRSMLFQFINNFICNVLVVKLSDSHLKIEFIADGDTLMSAM